MIQQTSSSHTKINFKHLYNAFKQDTFVKNKNKT